VLAQRESKGEIKQREKGGGKKGARCPFSATSFFIIIQRGQKKEKKNKKGEAKESEKSGRYFSGGKIRTYW